MTVDTEERNKALVLHAFDTLFNKRAYKGAEQLWSPNYIQHSAHIPPGRDGLFNLIRSVPSTLRYEPGVILAVKISSSFTADFPALGGRATGSPPTSSALPMAYWWSTGMSFRTRPLERTHKAHSDVW
jgi:hypothetical protein